VDVSNSHGKKGDRNCDPKDVLHSALHNRIHRLLLGFPFRTCASRCPDPPNHPLFKITERKTGL